MKNIRTLAALTACLATALYARTTYTTSVTSSLGVTITNSQHGFNSSQFGVLIYNQDGVKQPTTAYSWITGSNYDVTVSFASTFTGTVKLVGVYSSLTTADQDFKLTRNGSSLSQLYVCDGCQNSYAKRSVSGSDITTDERSQLIITSFPVLSGYVYAYIVDTGLVYQIPLGAQGTCSGGACSVVRTLHPETTPTGGIVLGSAVITNSGLGAVTDLRSF
ncbi:MAG: hypothetical protein C5B51_16950 [Terriglobia bacterium]|nr:MAG: hypothetical protein C5B51_16950 [Terriglobia bacterium]